MKAFKKEQLEAVKMLALQIGLRPAARKLNLKEDTVCQWASRYNWNISDSKPADPGPPNSVSSLSARPSDALAATLNDYKTRSKVALAKYAAEAAEEATEAPKKLKVSRATKDVADIHRTIWPAENQQQNILNLAVLVNPPARTADPKPTDAPEQLADARVVPEQQ